jgi:hypothetical protein
MIMKTEFNHSRPWRRTRIQLRILISLAKIGRPVEEEQPVVVRIVTRRPAKRSCRQSVLVQKTAPKSDPVPEPDPFPVQSPSSAQDPIHDPEPVHMPDVAPMVALVDILPDEETPAEHETGSIIVCANPDCRMPFCPEYMAQHYCSKICEIKHKKHSKGVINRASCQDDEAS